MPLSSGTLTTAVTKLSPLPRYVRYQVLSKKLLLQMPAYRKQRRTLPLERASCMREGIAESE